MLSSFQVFVIFQVMTNGGPSNQTTPLVMSIYENAFRYQNMGWAAAISMVLFAIIMFVTHHPVPAAAHGLGVLAMATLTLTNSPERPRPPQMGKILGQGISYAILILGTAVTLLPFVWALLTSLKSASEIIRIPPTFFPEHWTFNSYQTIFNDPKVPLARFFFNSLFVAAARVLVTLFTSSLAGFIFAKYQFWGKNIPSPSSWCS